MKSVSPLFGSVALGWLILGQILCRVLNPVPEKAVEGALWMLILWGLSILDLFALAILVSRILNVLDSDPEKRAAYWIQVLCLGIFKVVCLGLFVLILLKGHEIPIYGLLLGTGTLGIVPLVGGFLWSQRVLHNA